MAYLDEGSGNPAVVLLHAFPLDAAMWEPQIEALSSQWRVVAPTLAPEAHDPPSVDAMADTVALVIDELGLGPVVLGGLSMGGYAAFAFLRRHRELVRALVLADTRPGADTPEVRERRSNQQAQVWAEGPEPIFDAMLQTLPSEHTRQHRPDVLARIRRVMDGVPAERVVASLEAMKHRPDSTPDLAGIDVPALVIVGEEDAVSPPDVAEDMRDRLPDARLAVIPRAGHLSSLEDPDAFTTELRAFLEKLP
ncbi:MAG: alpha/beta fold hydrolase [Acidimicrobiales bacterium]